MKKGFTLAELLVTLGIIGVISALTLPSLINNVTDAKIGPSLAKAVAIFDQANKALLAEEEVDALSDLITLEVGTDVSEYWGKLANYMIIDINGIEAFSEEGFNYQIVPNSDTVGMVASSTPHLQEFTTCTIDINNRENKPNTFGVDKFKFKVMNDGSLQPWGANGEWKEKCPIGIVDSEEGYQYCAGHIFENGLKVLYE